MRVFLSILLCLTCLFTTFGCGTISTDLSYNPFTARRLDNPDPISVDGHSNRQVHEAVRQAAAEQGWTVLEDDLPMQLRYRYREALIIVSIAREGDVLLVTHESSDFIKTQLFIDFH